MSTVRHWLAPAAFVVACGALVPQAHAQNSLTHAIVHAADVVSRDGYPYLRNGNYGHNDRLLVRRDSHGRPVYYRTISSNAGHGGANHGAYGNGSYGYYGNYGTYSGASHGDDSYGYNSYYNSPPYGNANGYYRNGQHHNDRGHSRGHQRQRVRHDCYRHGGCDH